MPEWTGKTWSDLAAYVSDLIQVIDEQNEDNAAVRRFCEYQGSQKK